MPRRTAWTREQVRDVAVRQHGLITSAQLQDLGVPRSTVLASEHRVGGMFTFVLPGVHAFESGRSLTRLQRLASAQLYGGPDAVITGAARLRHRGVRAAAAAAFGPPDEVHLLVPHGGKRASRDFVVVERTVSMPSGVPDGLLRLAPIARAVLDACRRSTDDGAVRALVFEVVQKGLAAPESLNDERIKGQKRGSRFARLALEEVFAGARSFPEGELRQALLEAGLGRMLLNPRLTTEDGLFLACPDAYDELTGVCVEVDSREHHFSVASWEATMRRHARMTAAGLAVIHVPPSRLRAEPDAVLRDVWAAVHARAGSAPPRVRVTSPDGSRSRSAPC